MTDTKKLAGEVYMFSGVEWDGRPECQICRLPVPDGDTFFLVPHGTDPKWISELMRKKGGANRLFGKLIGPMCSEKCADAENAR